MTNAQQIRYAVSAWTYALAHCIHSLPEGPEREALIVCENRPTLANLRAVLIVGRNRPWLALIEAALVEIGLAAFEDILGEADHDHRG